MSKATLSVEGFLAEPRRGQTRDGKPFLSLSVGHTPRRKNRDTGQYEDAGDTMWVQATIWDELAQHLDTVLSKGTLVRLEGEPSLRSWESNGKSGVSLELKFAQVAIIPRTQSGQGTNSGQGGGFAGASTGGAANGPSAGGQDAGGWATPGATFDDVESPF